MKLCSFFAFALTALLGACNASQSPHPNASTESSTTEAVEVHAAEGAGSHRATTKVEKMDELNQFVEPNTKVLFSQSGDLNADGVQDAVLILDHVGVDDELLGEGAFRSTVLLVRDVAGKLRKARQNNKIVPCARCGGVAGDPFGYVRVEKGVLTVFNEGGSREHWSAEYTFQYSAGAEDWMLEKITRNAIDTMTMQDKSITLSQKEFGVIGFEEFDPSQFPPVEMP